ncbi:MAG: Spy/CpxP family protein refolding chaperone [Thermoguttaceae bacterium]
MKRRILVASVLVLALVTGMAAAFGPGASLGKCPLANTPVGKMITGCIGRLMVLRSELNVTDEQRAQIGEVLVSRRSAIAETVKSVRDKRVVLRDAVLSGKADEAQIRAAADELGKAIGDAAVKASKLRGEIAPILTQEQREQIRTFFQENDAAVDKFLTQAAQGK